VFTPQQRQPAQPTSANRKPPNSALVGVFICQTPKTTHTQPCNYGGLHLNNSKGIMKKLILTTTLLAGLLAASLNSFAQGRVNFGNTVTTEITNFLTGQRLVGPAGTYQFGLYMGPQGSTEAQLTLVATTLNPSTWTSATFGGSGLFIGGTVLLPTTIGGVDTSSGATFAFMVKSWNASLGSSYEAAFANLVIIPVANPALGQSLLGFVIPTISPNPAIPGLFGTGPGQVPSFQVNFIPEPSTIALCGLGAAVALLSRRRK
jgi:hypothetical protein